MDEGNYVELGYSLSDDEAALVKLKRWFREWYGHLPERELIANVALIREICRVEELLSNGMEGSTC
jgi:hypothetical protein